MKILHICNGAGAPFYNFLFQALKKQEVEQSVIIPVWSTPTVDYDDIHCEYFYRDSGFIARLRFRRKIKKLLKFTEEKVDVASFETIHAHTWFSDGAVAYKLHKKYGIPYIIAVRDTDINLFYKYFFHLRKLGYRILENASQIVFISPVYRDHLMTRLAPKIKRKLFHKLSVIPNGANPFWLANRNPIKILSSPVKLLSIGVIQARKNFLSLCCAVELLRNKGMDVQLTIVGKGLQDTPRYLKKLEKFIRNKTYITLLERQNQGELLKIYREHDIFVLPSYTETFGLVYIEALTQNLPVIYTRGQGIDGYFRQGEAGYAVNPKNIKEIAQAISLTINNYETLSANISQLDFSVFDWEQISNQYFEIYRNCKNQK